MVNAHSAGVENLLVFTEDYRITGDSLQEMMFFHVDAGKLHSVLEHLKEGHTVEGDSLEAKADFLLGSGVESGWGKNVPDLEMKEMEEMTRMGTGYFLTTPVFDLDKFAKFIQQNQYIRCPGGRRSDDFANCRNGTFPEPPPEVRVGAGLDHPKISPRSGQAKSQR